jgi:hypothetical protein
MFSSSTQWDYFPYVLIILGLIWYFRQEKKEEAKLIKKRIRRIHRPLTYLANGERIPYAHHVHYLTLLNLIDQRGIDDEVIKKAARKVIDEQPNQGVSCLPAIQDIKAAREFLLDQLHYATSWN